MPDGSTSGPQQAAEANEGAVGGEPLPTGAPAGGGPGRPRTTDHVESVFERVLAQSRLLVLVPVVVFVAAALGAFVYGTVVFVDGVRKVVDHPIPVGDKIGLFLVVIDLFLVGATLLIAAIGFYELFVSRVEVGTGARRLPQWLAMRDLNDLKVRVVGMLVLVAAVSFVQAVVDFADARKVLESGAGIAVFIVALTAFIRFGGQGNH